jgi:hypothetical protein
MTVPFSYRPKLKKQALFCTGCRRKIRSNTGWSVSRAGAPQLCAVAVQSVVVRIGHRKPEFHYWAKFIAGGKTVEYSF